MVADVPVSALVDDCPLYDLEPGQPEGWLYGNQVALEPRRRARSPARRSARIPERCLEALGVRAVRLDRPIADGAPARDRRCGGLEPGGDRQGDRGGDRRERAPRGLRPLPGHDRGGAGVRPEPRLRRSPAAGPDELPQLRQPREAARRLAARALGRRRSPTPAGRSRCPVVGGNVSLYNETEAGPIYPTPVVGMVGELPDPGRAVGIALADGDAIALVGPFAPSVAGSELAKLRGDLEPGLPATPIEAVREAIELVRDTARGGSDRRSPRRQRRGSRLRPGRIRDRWRGRNRHRPRPAGGASRGLRRGLPVRRGAGRAGRRRLGAAAERARRHRARAGRRRGPDRAGGRRSNRDLGRRGRASRCRSWRRNRAWRSLKPD